MRLGGRVLILAGALLGGAAGPPGAPQGVVEKFYDVRIHQLGPGGVPDAAARAKLATLLTPALARALADADSAESAYAKKTRNEVPPLVEGDLFSSLFEGPTSASVTGCKEDGPALQCPVALTYVDADKSTTRWTDTVRLGKTDSGWRIDDIVYGGTWAFGPKGKLRDRLTDVVKEAAQPGE